MTIKSILLLDDEQTSLDMITHLLSPLFSKAEIFRTRHPTEAIQLAKARCFELVLLDVTINYRGTELGGFGVYKTLIGRYGGNSILCYSKYIDDGSLERFGMHLNFIEQIPDTVAWIEKLTQRVNDLRGRQACFVAMPFGKRFNRLYAAI